MSKNIKSNNDEIPAKNGGDDQNNNIGLDINEVKPSKKQSSDGVKKHNSESINNPNKSSNKTKSNDTSDKYDDKITYGDKNSYKETGEFVIFQNELKSLIDNNLYILKECKSTKRLLDIKFSELEKYINYIQISVIAFSTLSGFLQSTKNYFGTDESIVSVSGIGISTYISLVLSVSKYFKLDEQKERIHNLREKYAILHNKIEYRMDILGPLTKTELWEHQNVKEKLEEWKLIKTQMDEEYVTIIETKRGLTTEYESIMDSKARNKNYITDRKLVLNNRNQLFTALQEHNALEKKIKESGITTDFSSAIELPDDDLNNWDDPV
jgi:hypothetical protein